MKNSACRLNKAKRLRRKIKKVSKNRIKRWKTSSILSNDIMSPHNTSQFLIENNSSPFCIYPDDEYNFDFNLKPISLVDIVDTEENLNGANLCRESEYVLNSTCDKSEEILNCKKVKN